MKKLVIKKAGVLSKSVGATLCMLFLLAACSGDTETATQSTSAAPAPLPEPTEPLVFEYSYDGELKVGEQNTVQLSFIEQYESGVISITVNETEGLSYYSLPAQSFSLETTTTMPMDLVIEADRAGAFQVPVRVDTLDSDGSRETRTFYMELAVI